MRTRAIWVYLSLGLFAAYLLTAGVGHNLPSTGCADNTNPTIEQAIGYGVPVVAFLVLAYLALVERELRWRIAELGVTVLLMVPAVYVGGALAYIYSGCAGNPPLPFL